MSEQVFKGQVDLFSLQAEATRNPVCNSCCVVLNGECQNVSWTELFDDKRFDRLDCVTYVSSAGFFAKAVSGFATVRIIIGIDKENVRQSFFKGLSDRIHNKGTEFFETLPDKSKEKLIASELVVRFSKPDSVIHSKFYLLSSSHSDETRLILGSANLTNTAFDNRVSQYEDVIVFDNSPLFEIYRERFDIINQATEDYVPRETITRYKEGKLISAADFTAEEKTDQIITALERDNIIPICNEAILEYAEEAAALESDEVTELRSTIEVITLAGKKEKRGGNGYVLKNAQELQAAKPKIVDILFKATKTEANIARFSLTYNDSDKKQYLIFPKQASGEIQRAPEVFDREASREEITDSVRNLTRFIDAYRTFVTEPDKHGSNLSRIYEIILYAFTSAYAFKLRQEVAGSKSDIPIMLVIGGRAASGKSNLLAYLDRILSGRSLPIDSHYIQFRDVKNQNAIGDLFISDNTYPILVDEVSQSFFKGVRGEDLIKGLSNTLSGKHPVMICTTNTGSFSIPAQVSRRIYYVQVDSCFDVNKKSQANAYYDEIMTEATNLLFRDFCNRMGEKIRCNEELFGTESFDYLHCAREIFKEYYSIAGIDLPTFFPSTLYNDYSNRGMNMWETLFEQKQELFSYREHGKNDEAVLTVNLKEAVSASGYSKDTEVYLNYLRQDLLVEEAGVFVVIRAEPFFRWIDIDNPWRKKSLLERLFKRNR